MKNKKGMTKIGLVLVLIILIVCVVVLFNVINNDKKKKNDGVMKEENKIVYVEDSTLDLNPPFPEIDLSNNVSSNENKTIPNIPTIVEEDGNGYVIDYNLDIKKSK